MFFITYFHSIFVENYSSFYSFHIFAGNKMKAEYKKQIQYK